jgi:hypothetical protein
MIFLFLVFQGKGVIRKKNNQILGIVSPGKKYLGIP